MEDDFIILLLDNGDGRDTANSLFFFVCVCAPRARVHAPVCVRAACVSVCVRACVCVRQVTAVCECVRACFVCVVCACVLVCVRARARLLENKITRI